MRKNFRDLEVWKRGIDLALLTYRATDRFPASERFGLQIQMRKAAVSIPSNVAEGQGRLTPGEWQHQLGVARGSLFELETQTVIAGSLGLISEVEQTAMNAGIRSVARVLTGLIDYVSRQRAKKSPGPSTVNRQPSRAHDGGSG